MDWDAAADIKIPGTWSRPDGSYLSVDPNTGISQVLDEMLRPDMAHLLPAQLAVELHVTPISESLAWANRRRSLGELASLARRMHDYGYRIISREDNALAAPCCSRLTAIRAFC